MKLSKYNKVLDFMKVHKKVALRINQISCNKEKKSLVDIGGGSGLLSLYLKNDFEDITVIEPSIKMTDNLNSDDDIKVINKSVEELDLNQKYDTVICFDSLHHFGDNFDDIKNSIDDMLSIANKEVIIIEPNTSTIKGRTIEIQENIFLRLRCYFLKKRDLEKLSESYKFNFEEFKSFNIIHFKV